MDTKKGGPTWWTEAIATAGQDLGAKFPVEFVAVYAQQDKPRRKLLVFKDATGKTYYTEAEEPQK